MAGDSGVRDGDYPFDVALSFASEQRNYVDKVAKALRRRGLKPFYDRYEQASMWGKDLYEHLDDVYRKQARYCVLFASKAYAEKAWTTHERRSAQARALEANSEYVLPVRFDDTEIPGLRPTIHYIDAATTMPAKLAQTIYQKLGPRLQVKYIPENPGKLFSFLDLSTNDEKSACLEVAWSLMDALQRMNVQELRTVSHIFREACPTDLLEERPHINLDVLRRDLRTTPAEILNHLAGISSLGFRHEVLDHLGEHSGETVVSLWWEDRRMYTDMATRQFAVQMSTEVASAMIRLASDGHCHECGQEAIMRLDFSQLATRNS